jgi:hypothetical protein
MMDHAEYRRALLADPHSEEPELKLHRATCAACSAFTEQLLQFEDKLSRALKIPAPQAAVLAFPARSPQRWYALAASFALAVLVGGVVWLGTPRSSLAADVVAHMAGEPDAWKTRAAVSEKEAADVFKHASMTLTPSAGVVSYASGCEFRRHVVPHLVVQSARGPVTVMVLVHEAVQGQQSFDEQGYRGTLVPIEGHGSIAVLMRTPDSSREDVERIAAQVRAAIVWN